jgi:hypothetical protein
MTTFFINTDEYMIHKKIFFIFPINSTYAFKRTRLYHKIWFCVVNLVFFYEFYSYSYLKPFNVASQ